MSEKSYRGLPCTFTRSPPCKDHRGVDLISNALPFRRLWYAEPTVTGKTYWDVGPCAQVEPEKPSSRLCCMGDSSRDETRVESLAWRLGCFTGCSGPLVVQTCSFRAVHSLFGFALSTLLGVGVAVGAGLDAPTNNT